MRIRATAIVIRQNKVLLVKDRGKRKFSLPGGKKNSNEPSLAAAVRELYEELGMSARKAERIFACDYVGSCNKHKVSLIKTDDHPILRSRELTEFYWWNMKDKIPRYAHVDSIIKHLGKALLREATNDSPPQVAGFSREALKAMEAVRRR